MAAELQVRGVLAQIIAPGTLSPQQWQLLVDWELQDPDQASAWGITGENIRSRLEERLHWLRQAAPRHGAIPQFSKPLDECLEMYWRLWLPLALRLKHLREQRKKPFIQGILGGQGTGKTTLTLILSHLLGMMGHRTIGLSIDDLYQTHQAREALRAADPRFKWRGPPGTHDVDLGIATLNQIHRASPEDWVSLPQFDKSLHKGSGDRVAPILVQGVDILLFEGWFLGVRPIAAEVFDRAPDPIQTEADRQFARDINARLQDYLPLWQCLDQLMVIYPEDYRISKQWRRQAEHQMKAQGKAGMSDADIDQFVEYFWRALHPDLFITPLKHDGHITSLVIEIDQSRVPRSIYSPD